MITGCCVITGGVIGKLNQKHTIRDGLFQEVAYNGLGADPDGELASKPLTGIEVDPSTDAKVDFDVNIKLEFGLKFGRLELPFGKFNLVNKSWELGNWDSGPWPEKNRMRLNTSSQDGDTMKQPQTFSHYPQSTHFATFPQDVDTCLADDAELPELPPPAAPSSEPGGPGSLPAIEGCIYAPIAGEFPTDACVHIDGYIPWGLTAEQEECVRAELEFICYQTNNTQYYDGRYVTAGVNYMTDSAQGSAFGEIAMQCKDAFGEADVANWVNFGACEADATLINPEDAIQPVYDNPGEAVTTDAFWEDRSGLRTKRIKFRHSGQCADVERSSQADGANVLQYTCHGTTNQRFCLVPTGTDNEYLLKVRHSGKCLTVEQDPSYGIASNQAGANIVQSTCNGGEGQTFETVRSGRYYLLKAKHSGLCVDVERSSRRAGANISQYTCTGTTNQQVTLY